MLRLKSLSLSLLFILLSAVSLSAQGDRPNRGDRPARPGVHAGGDESRPQQGGRRDFAQIKAARQDFLTQELELTEAEAAAFFPVFWRYEEEMRDLMQENRPGRRGRNAEPQAEPTETQARERIIANLEKAERVGAIKRASTEAYLKLIPAKKLIGLEAANREFRRELLDRIRRDRQ